MIINLILVELNNTFITENFIPLISVIMILGLITILLIAFNLEKNKEAALGIIEKKDEQIEYYFQLNRDKDNMFYYSLLDEDNKTIGESKKYKTKASCTNSIYMFKRIIKSNVIDNSDNNYKKVFGEEFVEIIKDSKESYKYNLISKRIKAVFMSREFESLNKCLDEISKISKATHIIRDFKPDDTTITDILKNEEVRQNTVNVVADTLYAKCKWQKPHSDKVSEICCRIAKEMGMDESEIEKVRITGLMHDIGKIIVPENALNKKQVLSDEEWETMKRHPEAGCKILASSKEFDNIASVVLQHHERWDGSGYPNGLKGEEIDIKARILAIADSYDAMISDRPYRKAMDKKEALEEIKNNSGKQFDPDIAKIFIKKIA